MQQLDEQVAAIVIAKGRVIERLRDLGLARDRSKARMTGLEPATSGVTGRCSNQLSYIPKLYLAVTCGETVWLGVSRICIIF